uniref:Uncharacterized protein n=1 Tax=Cacopsylla melanoneura TaxID=428564 RepID=A0A8D8ZBT1_9HEMI
MLLKIIKLGQSAATMGSRNFLYHLSINLFWIQILSANVFDNISSVSFAKVSCKVFLAIFFFVYADKSGDFFLNKKRKKCENLRTEFVKTQFSNRNGVFVLERKYIVFSEE